MIRLNVIHSCTESLGWEDVMSLGGDSSQEK